MNPQPLAYCSSIVSPNTLQEWLSSAYPLRTPMRCRLYRRSPSDAYRIDCPDGAFFLKILTHGWRTAGQMQSEVAILEFLLDRRVRVVRPIRRRDGSGVSLIQAPEGVRPAVLYAAAQGETYKERDAAHNRAFGREVAGLHNALDAFDCPLDRPSLDFDLLLDHHLAVIESWMKHRSQDVEYLRELACRVRSRIEALLPRASSAYGLCHGDANGGNALFGPAGCTMFDFDSCGPGFRAFDAAVLVGSCRWMDTDDEAGRQRARILAEFLEGYNEQRSMTPAEIEAIELFQPVYHLWLMGHVLEWTTIREGVSWADDNFFDWHMGWFRKWGSRQAAP